MIRTLRRSGAASAIRAIVFTVVCAFLPATAEAQGFGRIIGGAVGGSVLSSGTAIGGDRRFVVLRPQPVSAEGRRAGAVTGLAFDRDRNLLLVVLADGGARWWDLGRGLERGGAHGEGILAGLVRGGGRALFDPTVRPAVAENGVMAFRVRDGTWWIVDRSGKRNALPDAASDALPTLSSDGYRIAWRTGRKRAMRVMRLVDGSLEPGGLLSGCTGSGQVTAARFTPAGGRVLLGDARGHICLWDVSGGNPPRLLFSVATALKGPVRTLATDREGLPAAVGDGRETVELWPLAGRIERRSSLTLGLRAADALAVDGERGWLLAGGGHGTVVVHDFAARDVERRARPIARLFSTTDGWSVLDGNGRFDGSENGIEALSWAGTAAEGGAGHVQPVDSFSESHHEPGLLAKLDAPASALLNRTAADLPASGFVRPPQVMIELGGRDDTGRLSVILHAERGYPERQVAGLRLYRFVSTVTASSLSMQKANPPWRPPLYLFPAKT